MTAHWATAYIGEPWVAGEHDCWAFARRVWRERFGWQVPAVDVPALDRLACGRAFAGHPERAAWALVDVPREGDGVLLGTSRRASHVGVWIGACIADGGGAVLHCQQGTGVVSSSVQALAASGWRVLGVYRRRDWGG